MATCGNHLYINGRCLHDTCGSLGSAQQVARKWAKLKICPRGVGVILYPTPGTHSPPGCAHLYFICNMDYYFKIPFWRSYINSRNSVTNFRPKMPMVPVFRGKYGRKYPKRSAPRRQLKRTGGFKPARPSARELKFNDVSHQAEVEATIADANQDPGVSGSLTNISLGTSQSQRIGRCVYPKTLTIYGSLDVDEQVQNITDFYIQIWVVLDKQTNGAGMTSTDFLTSLGTTIQADAFQNLEYSDRFRLLKKMMIRIKPNTFRSGTGTDALFNTQVPFRIHCKLPAFSKQQYSNNTGGVSDITSESYHLLAIKSNGAPVCKIQYQCRCRYTD